MVDTPEVTETPTTETPTESSTTTAAPAKSGMLSNVLNWTKSNWIWLLVIVALIAIIVMKCNPFSGGAIGADLSEM